jgi:hypothetical protein
MESAIKNTAQHRFGVRVSAVEYDNDDRGEQPCGCSGIVESDADCFSRALCVALFCKAYRVVAAPDPCPVALPDCDAYYWTNISGLRAGMAR